MEPESVMTKRRFFAAVVIIAFTGLLLGSCKHKDNSQPLEPISLVQPDTPIVWKFGDSVQPIQVKFTTDRPINWILATYYIDTLDTAATYIPPYYPDTLFYQDLTTQNPRVNLYTKNSSYTVPDSLRPFNSIRFKISYQAGSNIIVPGQNYPLGIDSAFKTFTINVQ